MYPVPRSGRNVVQEIDYRKETYVVLTNQQNWSTQKLLKISEESYGNAIEIKKLKRRIVGSFFLFLFSFENMKKVIIVT